MDTFATIAELPSLTDTAYLAMVEGRNNAVEALARVMKRREQQAATR